MPTRRYQYTRVGRTYLCLQQNPVSLAWFLCLMNKPLGLGSLGLVRRKAARMVAAFALRQLRLRRRASMLELPVFGHLCLQAHGGYRVFDFRRKSVARVFAPEIDVAYVASEIARARDASLLDFVPTVRRWNAQERWYEEDFVIGHPGRSLARSKASDLLQTYCQNIEPCIEGMILLQTPLRTDLIEYVDRTINILEDDGLSTPDMDRKKVDTVRRFVEAAAERLRIEGNRQATAVDLVFSHGDFSLVNIIDTKNGIKVIDWESAGRRSVLFDLHNYFLTEVYYKRATPSIVSEIDQAIASLRARLAPNAPDLAETLPTLVQTYRQLYYLERVCTLLERALSDKRLDVILRSINVFERYEQAVTQRRENQ
jgi:hypothetical protein